MTLYCAGIKKIKITANHLCYFIRQFFYCQPGAFILSKPQFSGPSAIIFSCHNGLHSTGKVATTAPIWFYKCHCSNDYQQRFGVISRPYYNAHNRQFTFFDQRNYHSDSEPYLIFHTGNFVALYFKKTTVCPKTIKSII